MTPINQIKLHFNLDQNLPLSKKQHSPKTIDCKVEQISKFLPTIGNSPSSEIKHSEPPLNKSLEIVKLGLIFEDKHQMQNRALHKDAFKLLMHKTPVIVNRNFMLAHRHLFVDFQAPLTWYHQKGGQFTVIIPKGAGNVENLGFNPKELVQGSFKDLVPLEEIEVAQSLDKLLLKETAEKQFARIGPIIGHGDQTQVAGLSFDELFKIQEILSAKGMRLGILQSCFAGAHLDTLKKCPFPLIVMSSSEVSSVTQLISPSFDNLLEYAKEGLKKGNLVLDMESLEANDSIRELFKTLHKENTPTIVLPGQIFGINHLQGLTRLEERMINDPIELESGFISPGSTKQHIVQKVNAKTSLETIAETTFSLLDLAESSTRKGIFIRKMQCPVLRADWFSKDLENVIFYASQHQKTLLFSTRGFFGTSYYLLKQNSEGNWTDLESISTSCALFYAYQFYAKTQNPKEKPFLDLDEATPLHKVYSFLVHASCMKEFKKEQFLKLIKQLKESGFEDEIGNVKIFAENLELKDFADLAAAFLTQPTTTEGWQKAFMAACSQNDVELAKKISLNAKIALIQPQIAANALKEALKSQKSAALQSLIQFLIESMSFPKTAADQEAYRVIICTLIENAEYKWIEFILKSVKKISKDELSTVLKFAILKSDQKALELILSKGVDPNVKGTLDSMPLFDLCSLPFNPDQIEMLQLLVKYGANVNVLKDEETPLLKAVVKRNIPIVEFLVKNGAFLNLKGEFERAIFDPELKKLMLQHCTLEQLKNSEVHPLVIALCSKDFEAASSFIEKGVVQEADKFSFILDYLTTMKNRADIEVLDWILSQPKLNKSPIENQLFSYLIAAIEFSSLEVIKHFEKQCELKKFDPLGLNTLCAALNRYLDRVKHKNLFKLPHDRVPQMKANSCSEKSLRKNILYFLEKVENFSEFDFLNTLELLPFFSEEIRNDFMRAVIQKSPHEICRTFYTALHEGNIHKAKQCQLSESDIVKIWEYFPPYFFLRAINKPSKELIEFIIDLAAKLPFGENDQEVIRQELYKLSSDYFDLKLRVLTCGTMQQAFKLCLNNG